MPTAVIDPTLRSVLAHFAGIREQRFRPLRWRTLLPVDASVPKWAENFTIAHRVDYAQPPTPVGPMGVVETIAPTEELTGETFPVVEYAMHYGVMDRELDRARATGTNPSATRATANDRAAETLLDQIAAVGDSRVGLTGIANNAGVAVGTVTNGTWVYGTTTLDEIVEDCFDLIDAVRDNSLEVHEADTMILPETQFRILTRTRNTNTDQTAARVLLDILGRPFRILPWHRLATASGGNPRTLVFDSGEDVARMILPQELEDDPPRRVARGSVVDQSMVCGGVLVESPLGMVYCDTLD